MTSPALVDVPPLDVIWLLYTWQEEQTTYKRGTVEGSWEPVHHPAQWKLFRKDGINGNLLSGYLTFDAAMKAAKAVCVIYGEQTKPFRIVKYHLHYAGSMTQEVTEKEEDAYDNSRGV